MKLTPLKLLSFLIVLSTILFVSCAQTPLYDQRSFDQTIDAKVETIGLMENATEEYSIHENDIREHLQELQKIYEYDKRRSHNAISGKMWELMLNKDKNSVAGFFGRWSENGTLRKAFVDEAIIQIEDSFDLLLDYESAKNKAESDDLGTLLLSFISNI